MAGSLVGILTFLVGTGLILLTFYLAYSLFRQPPDVALGLKSKVLLDVNESGTLLMSLIFKIMLLIVMCIAGSVIANRGIKLYSASYVIPVVAEAERPPQSNPETKRPPEAAPR